MKDLADVIAGMLTMLFIGFLMGSCEARADTWLVGTVASYHSNRAVEHNERNWGLGIESEVNDRWRVTAGGYRNSYYRDSFYAGALWTPVSYGRFRCGVLFGAITGYDRILGPFAPTVLPTLMYEGKQWGANLGVMPSPERGVGVLGLQLKWRFQ